MMWVEYKERLVNLDAISRIDKVDKDDVTTQQPYGVIQFIGVMGELITPFTFDDIESRDGYFTYLMSILHTKD